MSQFDPISGREAEPADPLASSRPAWHGAAPSVELATALFEIEERGTDALDDYALVELVAAAQRLSSWAHHLAASAAGALSDRESMEPPAAGMVTRSLTAERLAGEEVAMRLGWTPRAGQRLVEEGRHYRTHLVETGEALRRGDIDPSKAKALRETLADVPWQLGLGVQEIVLPHAPRRTPAQLARDARAALVDLDPHEAQERRERATKDRYLSPPKPLPDGMAGMWLRTTALDAKALWDAVDAGARAARSAGDPRTLEQLRADLLVERSLHEARCSDPLANRPRAGSPGSRCRTAVRVDVRVLVPLATVVGTSEDPGFLEGYGTIDPEHARALARGGTWRRLVTDPTTGTVLDVGRTRYTPPPDMSELVRFRDLECVHPGCSASAWTCELDHTVPFRPNSLEGGATSVDNLAPLSKGCHQLKTHGGFTVRRSGFGEYEWRTPTGHVYRAPVRSAIGSLDGRNMIHPHRHELEEISPPRPPTGGDPPRALGPRQGDRAGDDDAEPPDSEEPPPF